MTTKKLKSNSRNYSRKGNCPPVQRRWGRNQQIRDLPFFPGGTTTSFDKGDFETMDDEVLSEELWFAIEQNFLYTMYSKLYTSTLRRARSEICI